MSLAISSGVAFLTAALVKPLDTNAGTVKANAEDNATSAAAEGLSINALIVSDVSDPIDLALSHQVALSPNAAIPALLRSATSATRCCTSSC